MHADAAHLTNGATAFSIACWIKTSAKAFGMIYSESNPMNTGPFFFFMLSGSSPHTTGHQLEMNARTAGSGSVDVFQGSVDVATSSWHHVAITQNASSQMAMYSDGVADGTFTRTANSNSNTQTFTAAIVGADRLNVTTNFFPGLIAQMGTWTRQLAASEVAALASGLLPPSLGAAHYWPLWGFDSPEPDLSSSSVDGTLTGTTLGAGGPPVTLSMLGL